jgi:hypothetical protein
MRWRTVLVLLTLGTVSFPLAVDSAGAASPAVLAPQDRDYPESNAHPVHPIQITGTISPTLGLELVAQYQGCLQTVNRLEGANARTLVEVPLTVESSNGSFHATAVNDRFVPGSCNWHLHSVSARLSKNGLTGLGGDILVAVDEPNFSPELIAWAGSSGPVIWRCRFSKLRNLPKGMLASPCNFIKDRQPDDRPYRILLPTTTSIEARLIDLETDESATTVGADHPVQGSPPR